RGYLREKRKESIGYAFPQSLTAHSQRLFRILSSKQTSQIQFQICLIRFLVFVSCYRWRARRSQKRQCHFRIAPRHAIEALPPPLLEKLQGVVGLRVICVEARRNHHLLLHNLKQGPSPLLIFGPKQIGN